MELFQSLILGAVQGLTEFLPISSSGHLILVPWLLGWKDLGLTFDAALHLGTLLAIVVYFRNDWIEILKKWREKLLWLILVGCLPAALAGFLFEDIFERVFRSAFLISIFMITLGLLLWLAELYGEKQRNIRQMNFLDSIFIGFAQVLALMPGVSRSGVTMTAGLFAGLSRESAARFSFLLSTPIILGAGLFKMRHIITHGFPANETSYFIIGILSSAIVGFFTIKYLLAYLKTRTFYVFVWYRLIVGVAIMILLLWRR